MPGLGIPGLKGEKVSNPDVPCFCCRRPAAQWRPHPFLPPAQGDCGVCQPAEVGSGPAGIKISDGSVRGKPGEPGPPGPPGIPGLGAEGKQVGLLSCFQESRTRLHVCRPTKSVHYTVTTTRMSL